MPELQRRIEAQKRAKDSADIEDPDPYSERGLQGKFDEFVRLGFAFHPHTDELDTHTVTLGQPVTPGQPSQATLRFHQATHQRGGAPVQIEMLEVDERFRGRGIGQLALIKALQCDIENYNPGVRTVQASHGNMALVGVMRNLFGHKNVIYQPPAPETINQLEDKYQPPFASHIETDIDRNRIMAIDVDQKLRQLAETGHITFDE